MKTTQPRTSTISAFRATRSRPETLRGGPGGGAPARRSLGVKGVGGQPQVGPRRRRLSAGRQKQVGTVAGNDPRRRGAWGKVQGVGPLAGPQPAWLWGPYPCQLGAPPVLDSVSMVAPAWLPGSQRLYWTLLSGACMWSWGQGSGGCGGAPTRGTWAVRSPKSTDLPADTADKRPAPAQQLLGLRGPLGTEAAT